MSNDITVKVFRNILVVSSIQVAEHFEKRHKNVLQLLSLKLSSANKDRLSQHFFKSSYKDETGKKNTMYLMDRDGFTFLVMGFTGAKADKRKLDFIDAFNAMEKQLKEQSFQSLQDIKSRLAELESECEEKDDIIQKLENVRQEQIKTIDLWASRALMLSAFKDYIFANAVKNKSISLDFLNETSSKIHLLE